VYEVAKDHLPKLLENLTPLIKTLEKTTGWKEDHG
jgi:hypothetical protein